jgi:phasin family protein
MFTTPAQFSEIQKGQMDAAFALGQTFFDATERLLELNIAAAKATLEESVERAQALMSAKDVQEFVALSSALSQPTLEKAVSYSRTVYGIANGAGTEVSRIVESQMAENNKKVTQLIDFAAKNAPAGSEPAVRRAQERCRRRQHRVRHVHQGCQAGRGLRRVERRCRDVGHDEGRFCRQRRRQDPGEAQGRLKAPLTGRGKRVPRPV